MAQDKPAYLLLNSKGKPVSYEKALKELAAADVVLFGEFHNNPISHWLELELLQDLHERRGELVLGMEMFESDQQAAVDAYLFSGQSRQDFEAGTRLWPNYTTDYRPLVEYCRSMGIPVVASNAPRTLARQVAREGIQSLDSLPDSTKALLAPLPINIDMNLSSYQEMLGMMAGHGGSMKPEHFVQAQAIKDATMASRLLGKAKAGSLLYHGHGAFHSDFHQGIEWYLRQAQPGLKILTITTVEMDSSGWDSEGHAGRADFFIVVPTSMTKTYVAEE